MVTLKPFHSSAMVSRIRSVAALAAQTQAKTTRARIIVTDPIAD